jgi:hypothetical protein
MQLGKTWQLVTNMARGLRLQGIDLISELAFDSLLSRVCEVQSLWLGRLIAHFLPLNVACSSSLFIIVCLECFWVKLKCAIMFKYV